MSDNFHLDISCAPLAKCLDIAFGGAPGGKASHWRADALATAPHAPPRLVLAWHEAPGFTALPAPMDAEGVIPFVKAWLSSADYGPEPDHDGDNGRSQRVYNEAWGHVDGCSYAFVAIEPCWAMYGK